MSSPAQFYAKQTHRRLGRIYHATWMPNEVVAIGSVGVLQDKYFFRRLTSLENLGVPFRLLVDESPSPLDLTFESGTSITFKAAGESNAALPSVPVAKAGVGIEFTRNGAFVVKAAESFADSIDDIPSLQARLRQLVANGAWSKEWVVVVKATRCPAATIVISRSSSAKVEFTVEGDIPAGGAKLGSANLELGLSRQTNAVFSFENARNVTPFLQLARLTTTDIQLLGASAATLASGAGGSDGDAGLAALSPNDFKAAASELSLSSIQISDDPDDEG